MINYYSRFPSFVLPGGISAIVQLVNLFLQRQPQQAMQHQSNFCRHQARKTKKSTSHETLGRHVLKITCSVKLFFKTTQTQWILIDLHWAMPTTMRKISGSNGNLMSRRVMKSVLLIVDNYWIRTKLNTNCLNWTMKQKSFYHFSLQNS